MKKNIYFILIVFVFACNTATNDNVSNLDTADVQTIQKSEDTLEKKPVVAEVQPIEIRFDKIQKLLVKDLSQDKVSAIEAQIKSSIAASDGFSDEKIFTKNLKRFLEDIPDDIMIDMDPSLEKKFKKKWEKTHDVYNIGFMHPYYDGNGGCETFSMKDFDYLGTYNNAYFVEVKILCKGDGSGPFRRFFKVIEDAGSFKIDGIYNF
jgi:hypothetical protein